MQHVMKLQSQYFNYVLYGTKRIEIRLYDEKRQKVKIGDTIKFLNIDDLDIYFVVKVTDLLRYQTIEELINEFDISLLADNSITKMELINAVNEFYTLDMQKYYGVLGIKFELI